MTPPALRHAATDATLRGAPLAVYCHLLHALDPNDFRVVKVSSIAHDLHLKEVTAAWALRRLVERGYLERAGSDRLRSYRLVWSRTEGGDRPAL